MARYIGITLGPIGDTMSLTSTPAGLWAASYLFSYLAYRIRVNIGKDGLIQDSLQYEENADADALFKRGIGLYHDRIIYEADEIHTLESAAASVKKSVSEIVEGFSESEIFADKKDEITEFFRAYFNIHMLCIEVAGNENFLLKINDALDAAELEKNFPAVISENPILSLFDGEDKKRNEEIKKSFLVSKNDKGGKLNWILTNDSERGIKDLKAIASPAANSPYDNKEKASKYYAVIRADGDNMGSTIKSTIQNENDYMDFSNKCFRYGCRTAEIVLKYGGIPIYVGGDDLLCIAPLMYKDSVTATKHTFLEMIKEIRKAFKDEFPGEPDLSFGVQIQYVKAPLYEALNDSGRLLFGTAKSNKPGAVAVNLRKHSGQSAEILIKNIGSANGEMIRNTVDELIKRQLQEDTLNSVGKHVSDFATLLNQAGEIAKRSSGENEGLAFDNYFNNVFDNGVKDEDVKYLAEFNKLAMLLNDGTEDVTLAERLGAYIRIIKFFSEKIDIEEA